MRRNVRGFTMVELLLVVVLGSLIVAAILQVLITNQRIYTAQNAGIQGTQSIRGSLAVLSSELREISPPGGDLLMMDPDSLRVRAMRAVGVVCHDTIRGIPAFRVVQVADPFVVGDSVVVFADNNSLKSWDDAWIATTVVSATSNTSCAGGADTQSLILADAALFLADSVSSGAEIRAFTEISYGLMQLGTGDWFLGQKLGLDDWTPAVGPLTPNRGLSFAYLDETGTVTATPSDVTMIDVTVRTGSNVVGPTGNLVRDSVTVRIHTRN